MAVHPAEGMQASVALLLFGSHVALVARVGAERCCVYICRSGFLHLLLLLYVVIVLIHICSVGAVTKVRLFCKR